MATNIAVVVDVGTFVVGTWGTSTGTRANPSVSFDPVQAKAFTDAIITNQVIASMATATVTTFAGSAVGVTLTLGSATISATPNAYANIMDGGMPGPAQGFVPSVKDIALGVSTLITSSIS